VSAQPTSHFRWLVGASLGAVGWAVLVHHSPLGDWWFQKVFCLGWMVLAWKALRPEDLPRMQPRARELWVGAGVGAVMVAVSWAVARGVCGGSALAVCAPVGMLISRAAEIGPGSLLGIGLIIVPAEELFWHGTVHAALRPKLGRVGSAAGSTALLGLSYWGVGEWQLALLVVPTFLTWGLLAEWRRSVWSAGISHLVWTPAMILLLGHGVG
jgi:membrane protease YdiL (CAAX protease family)